MEHSQSRGAKGGLRDLCPSQTLYRFVLLFGCERGRWKDVTAERFFKIFRQACFGPIECLPDLGEIHGQLGQHVGILGTLARKQEGNLSSVLGWIDGVIDSSWIVQTLLRRT